MSLTVGALAQESTDPNNLMGSGKEPAGKFIQPVASPALDLLKIIDLHLDYSWVPQSNVSSSAAYRKATEQTLQIDATAKLKVNDRLSLSIGGEYEDFFYSFQQPNRHATFPLFHNLGVVGVKAGFGYEFSQQWSVFGNVSPSFNGDLNKLTGRDFVMSGTLALKYSPYGNDKLFFLAGAMVRSNGSIPAFPVAGVRWQVTDALTLNLTTPRPEIDYSLNQTLLVLDSVSGKELATLRIGKWIDDMVYDPVRCRIFVCCGDGTLSVVRQDSPDSYAVEEVVQTELGVHTMAFDSITNTIYAPVAKLTPISPEDPRPIPQPIPGTFHILVLSEMPRS